MSAGRVSVHKAQTNYLAGDAFSIADISFGVVLDFAQGIELQLPFELPNIVRYRADLSARPSWAAH